MSTENEERSDEIRAEINPALVETVSVAEVQEEDKKAPIRFTLKLFVVVVLALLIAGMGIAFVYQAALTYYHPVNLNPIYQLANPPNVSWVNLGNNDNKTPAFEYTGTGYYLIFPNATLGILGIKEYQVNNGSTISRTVINSTLSGNYYVGYSNSTLVDFGIRQLLDCSRGNCVIPISK